MKKYLVDRGRLLPSGSLGLLYRYETNRGIISMATPSKLTNGAYEIYSIEGDLFDDVERFDTLEEAEKRIIELIGNDFIFGR